MLRVLVITVSDRASKGIYDDRSGPEVERVLRENVPECHTDRVIVPDDRDDIIREFESGLSYDAVLTTGGTGLGPRDITPETTEEFCERAVPGIAEYLRQESLRETSLAPLSRAYAGQRGSTLFVNLPGSVKGARSTTGLLAPILEHARSMIAGEGH